MTEITLNSSNNEKSSHEYILSCDAKDLDCTLLKFLCEIWELARQQTGSNYKKYKKDEKANNNITKPKLSKIMVQESLRESNNKNDIYLMKHILYWFGWETEILRKDLHNK